VSESSAEPSVEAFVEELRKAKVADLIVLTCSTLAQLAYGKLSPEVADLEQARLAIDALKALVGVLPEADRRDLNAAVANLQLAYAAAAKPPETAP